MITPDVIPAVSISDATCNKAVASHYDDCHVRVAFPYLPGSQLLHYLRQLPELPAVQVFLHKLRDGFIIAVKLLAETLVII